MIIYTNQFLNESTLFQEKSKPKTKHVFMTLKYLNSLLPLGNFYQNLTQSIIG